MSTFTETLHAIKQVHPDFNISKSSFVSRYKKCQVTCPITKQEYTTRPDLVIRYGKCKCDHCKRSNDSKRYSYEQSLSRLREKFPSVLLKKSSWLGHNEPCTFKCKTSGDLFTSTVESLISRKKGMCPCPTCSFERFKYGSHNSISLEEATSRLAARFPMLQLKEYQGYNKPCVIFNPLTGETIEDRSVSWFCNTQKAPLAEMLGMVKNLALSDLKHKPSAKLLKKKGLGYEEILARVLVTHGGLVQLKSKPTRWSEEAEFKHVCGHIWSSKVSNLLTSRIGCPKCSKIVADESKRKNLQKTLTANTDSALWLLEQQRDDRYRIHVGCSKCGNTFQKQQAHLRVWKHKGCPRCAVNKSSAYSAIALNWLESIAKLRQSFIQHALNKGEHAIKIANKLYRVDGYEKETKTVFEFLGDNWHTEDDGGLMNKDYERFRQLTLHGYNVVFVREVDWRNGVAYSGILIGFNNQNFFAVH